MKKILAYSEQANCSPQVIAALTDAMKCSAIIPKNANNMMDVGRLQGFTVSPTLYFYYCTIIIWHYALALLGFSIISFIFMPIFKFILCCIAN